MRLCIGGFRLNTSTCFAQLFGVGVPLLLRRSMLGARSQGQRIHVSVARKVAEDHGIPEADAADALAYVSTQQRFAFLSAGFRPGYLHWHVSCPLLASHASRAGTLRAHLTGALRHSSLQGVVGHAPQTASRFCGSHPLSSVVMSSVA